MERSESYSAPKMPFFESPYTIKIKLTIKADSTTNPRRIEHFVIWIKYFFGTFEESLKVFCLDNYTSLQKYVFWSKKCLKIEKRRGFFQPCSIEWNRSRFLKTSRTWRTSKIRDVYIFLQRSVLKFGSKFPWLPPLNVD
jgi:hypothetical protein